MCIHLSLSGPTSSPLLRLIRQVHERAVGHVGTLPDVRQLVLLAPRHLKPKGHGLEELAVLEDVDLIGSRYNVLSPGI